MRCIEDHTLVKEKINLCEDKFGLDSLVLRLTTI